ncbi:MAG TPA: hypothetical protein VJZ27_07410 [Aggregatilineales bacterium]|nr:hypothetical protein [Aggregatilineales bacterium]
MTSTEPGRQPTEAEIEAVINAFDTIRIHINPTEGTIQASGWREVYDTLAALNEFEIWLGLCSLEAALFDSDDYVTASQATLYELFRFAYENGIEAI